MNNTVEPARILVEINPGAEEGKAEINVTLDGKMNTLLNGLHTLNAHFLKTMVNDLGKELAMAVFAGVQINAFEEAGIDPEAELRADAARTFATLAHIFDTDEEEEAEAE